MTSYDAQLAAFGSDQDVAPPDTQMAASATKLVEFVNNSGAIYDRATLARTSFFDLYSLFAVPTGYRFTDPRLLYDPASARWVASAWAEDASFNSIVWVLVSNTSDPSGVWTRYTVPAPQNGTEYDQPKVGVSQDKVVISWNDFPGGGSFSGSETWVLSYTRMLNQQPTPSASFAPDSSKPTPAPVQQLTSQSRQWVVYNTTTAAGIESIDGDPILGNVSSNWNQYSYATTFNPPSAPQLGSATKINTGFVGALSGVFRNGRVWMATNDSCTVGSSTVLACVRLTQWNVTVSPPTLLQSMIVGAANSYIYDPAITMDGNGDTFFVWSRSSASDYVMVQGADQIAGAPLFSVSGTTLIKAGQQPYGGFSAWGDYSAAGPDPAADANRVWVAGEYAASGSAINWGTAAGQMSP